MKKQFTLFFILFSFSSLFAQEKTSAPKISLKWAPTGLTFGNVDLQGEYNFGKNSLTAKIGVPVNVNHTFPYDNNDARFSVKSTSFLAGYRTYLSRRHMRGLYFEPYFKYVHQTGEGTGNGTLTGQPVVMNFTNEYNGVGVGAEIGAQFIVARRFVIDLFFLGPELNSASNTFQAVEVSNTLPWTQIQADEAEQKIRDFINQFPFVKNHTSVMVDKPNKQVTADFHGLLPGYRIGVSLGVAL